MGANNHIDNFSIIQKVSAYGWHKVITNQKISGTQLTGLNNKSAKTAIVLAVVGGYDLRIKQTISIMTLLISFIVQN